MAANPSPRDRPELLNPFSVHFPSRILFGPGVLSALGDHAVRLGKRALIVTDQTMRRLGVCGLVEALLQVRGISAGVFDEVEPDPTTATLNRGVRFCRDLGGDFVIGVGGGSCIDAAKAIAAGAPQEGSDVWKLILGNSPGSDAVGPQTLPIVAIPTTAGTGTEATMGAVLRNVQLGAKECIGSAHIAPVLALVDPELSISMPPGLTAATGLDALTQCIESFVSSRANPVSDALALKGAALIWGSIRQAVAQPESLEARAGMALGATLSGMALSQAGVGAAHAVSMVLGGRYGVQHGVGVSLALPGTIRLNAQRSPSRYALLAKGIGLAAEGAPEAETASGLATAVERLVADLKLASSLAALGVPGRDYPDIARAAIRHPDMACNPAKLEEADILALLEANT